MGAVASVQPDPSTVADAAAHFNAIDRHAQPSPQRFACDTLTHCVCASLAAARHRPRAGIVTRTMVTLRAALPLVRALILAGLAIYLILFALPTVLGIAAAATP